MLYSIDYLNMSNNLEYNYYKVYTNDQMSRKSVNTLVDIDYNMCHCYIDCEHILSLFHCNSYCTLMAIVSDLYKYMVTKRYTQDKILCCIRICLSQCLGKNLMTVNM